MKRPPRLLLWMLATALPSRVVAEPCAAAQVLALGATASCDGLLIPEDFAKAALRCQQVEVPTLQANVDMEKGLRAADATVCTARTTALQKALDTAVGSPTPSVKDEGHMAPIVAAGAVGAVVGLVVGFFAGRK